MKHRLSARSGRPSAFMRVVRLASLAPRIAAPLGRVSSRGLLIGALIVGSSRVDLQACKLEYSIVSPK